MASASNGGCQSYDARKLLYWWWNLHYSKSRLCKFHFFSTTAFGPRPWHSSSESYWLHSTRDGAHYRGQTSQAGLHSIFLICHGQVPGLWHWTSHFLYAHGPSRCSICVCKLGEDRARVFLHEALPQHVIWGGSHLGAQQGHQALQCLQTLAAKKH